MLSLRQEHLLSYQLASDVLDVGTLVLTPIKHFLSEFVGTSSHVNIDLKSILKPLNIWKLSNFRQEIPEDGKYFPVAM